MNRIIAAAAALLIVIVALAFISINPALLYGVPTLLWAVAAIVRAINSTGQDTKPPQLPDSVTRQNHPDDNGDRNGHDEPTDDVPGP
ncbi:hypothetical protein [Amycolatopsis camponoti]|uniref:hypothetical protein n=1 Tax=Amycolatopsis camponoti TaxID=2606593 RepID=UPI0012D7B4A1|nr:hypothetical protein [Amycolatopsis camponoti]